MPITEKASSTVYQARNEIVDIIHGKDDRLLVVVGPCSIHDTKAALDYAALLKTAIKELSADLRVVMRVYFEKPRTTTGWKGLINDPHLDGSGDVNWGLRLARRVLLDVLAGNPEATLDEDTKSLLDDTFARFLPNRSVIFLPHRISTIRSCDQLFLLHKGRLEATGDHRRDPEQLLRLPGAADGRGGAELGPGQENQARV